MTVVTLYKDIDLNSETPSQPFTSSVDNLSQVNMQTIDWNDQVSSIEVSGGSATFYGDINFNQGLSGPFITQGWSKTLPEGQYGWIPDVRNPLTILDSRTYGMWNDQISSVKVPAGVTVKLYRDSNFGGGDPLILHTDDSDLRNDILLLS